MIHAAGLVVVLTTDPQNEDPLRNPLKCVLSYKQFDQERLSKKSDVFVFSYKQFDQERLSKKRTVFLLFLQTDWQRKVVEEKLSIRIFWQTV